MADRSVTIVGAGLAGSEAALCLSRAGVSVDLYEMRPAKLTPAHRSGRFAELVCSNSLGSGELTSGKGLLKEELRILGSDLLSIAEASRVPAGKALAVDREEFGRRVTEAVRSCPGIRVHEEEVTAIPGDPLVILACGPLASDDITSAIRDALGDDGFYFYDAISPIVDAGTIDPEESFVADRYGVGTGDYLNLPMDRERYEAFLSALLTAKTVALRAFEEPRYFEGCMPVEEIARRGPDTLLFGPAAAGRSAGPAIREDSARRRPASEGKRGGDDVQSGRFPDPPDLSRAEAGLLADPGALVGRDFCGWARCIATVSWMPDGTSIRGWSSGSAPDSSSRARSRGSRVMSNRSRPGWSRRFPLREGPPGRIPAPSRGSR